MTGPITCPHGHPVTDATICPLCAAAAGSDTATLPPAAVEAPTIAPASASDVPPSPERVTVPGYEIIGELGRGGMGVVYKARQAKLGRLVALKMILSGGHAGAADLARFRTEAEAIARLQHPNIVQIHEVGDHGGLPYFSLEFCAGGSLEKKLAGTPLPPKEAAALVETLARAMQAAHEKGVIHRDLKPANVLLGEDGTPKVTDFGLAKKLDEAGQTASGAVMGTPSYMAPEQAGYKPEAPARGIGPAADVYALGAILYECLTGRPPFRGPTPMDTMMQVVADEPVPVRRLQPQVPADVETICLKCLQKEAGRRYESAAALADDLRRFQNGEPIVARPVGRLERGWKLARRRPAAAALLVVSLLGGLVLLGTIVTAAAVVYGKNQSLTAALGRAEEEKNKAIEFRNKALDALRATTGTDVEKLLGEKKELSANERAYLEAIAERWQAFARQEGTDEQSRAVQAEGHDRVAYLWQKLGRREEARPEYERAADLWEKLADDFPTVPEYRRVLAIGHNSLGNLLAELGKWAEAEEKYHKALAIQEKLGADFPAVPDYRRELAMSYNNLGLLLADLGKRAEAEEQYRQALAIQERLAADFPTVPACWEELAASHHNLGLLLKDLGKRAEAEEQCRGALAIQEKLAADFPTVPAYRQNLAISHNYLGILLLDLGKRAEAEGQFRKALAIREKLAADFPAVPAYQIDLAGSYCNHGNLVCNGGRASESLGWFDKAIATLAPVHRAAPRDVRAKQFLRNSYQGRAVAYDTLTKPAAAVKDWDRAIELSPPAEQLGYRASRATSRLQAGMVAEAVAEVAELMKSSNWNAGQWYDFACIYALASGKVADKKPEYADRAMELLRQAVKSGYKDAGHMKQDSDLDPLRGRDDFKKLLAELEEKAAAKK